MNRTHKRWWRRPSRIIPLASILLALIALVGFVWASRSELQKEIESIRARGLPTTPAELNAWYKPVPHSENLAEAILAAHAKFVVPPEKRNPDFMFSSRDILKGERLPALLTASATQHVEKNREAIQLLHVAAKLNRSRYPVDLSTAPIISAPHRSSVKTMVQLLRWDALLKAEEGDAAGASESLIAGFAVPASLEEEPLLISALIRMSCLHIHTDTLEQVLNRVKLDDEQLTELMSFVQRAEKGGKSAFYRMVIGERAIGLSYLNSMTFDSFEQIIGLGDAQAKASYEKLPGPLRFALFKWWQGLGIQEREAGFFIASMGKWEEIAQLDYPEMWRAAESLDRELNQQMGGPSRRYIVAKVLLPTRVLSTRKEVLIAARLRCVRAAIAAQRFRLKNDGSIPTLDKLTPDFINEWPRDPVNNEPLALESQSHGGFRVIGKASTALANEGRASTSTNLQEIAFTIVR